MKVLVTGGAGFIGSHVADALLSRGDKVICIDDFNDYYNPEQKEANISMAMENENFVLYRGDIRDYGFLHRVFSKEMPDKVIHLAARAGVRLSIKQPLLYEEVNVKGTLSMLELAKDFKVKNFVFASSSSIYGVNKKIPFSEEDRVDNQISPYAVTKRAGELLCRSYHGLYGMNISCLRLFTVYGPRGRPDMAPYKFTKLIDEGKELEMYGDGTTMRDYTFIADIVSGFAAALDKDYGFEIFNLGNSQTVELKYFISVIEGLLGKKARIIRKPMQPGDVPITYADVSKAKKMLGYNPKTSAEEGMKKFIDWYKGAIWISR